MNPTVATALSFGKMYVNIYRVSKIIFNILRVMEASRAPNEFSYAIYPCVSSFSFLKAYNRTKWRNCIFRLISGYLFSDRKSASFGWD